MRTSLQAQMLGVVVAAAFIGTASAASVTFSGRILAIDINNGGEFAAASSGDAFNASFSYPDSAGASTISEPDEADYELAGSAALTIAAASVAGSAVNVNIQNGQPLDRESADFLNNLLSLDPAIAPNARVDTFTLGGLQQGAFESDPTPNDGDDEEQLFNGVGFELVMLTTDSTLYDSLDYRPLPPAFGRTEVSILVVREADAAGTIIFQAFGQIERVDAGPLFGDGFESVPSPAPTP